jgi:predicted ATPase/class 3 adenylate cyclase
MGRTAGDVPNGIVTFAFTDIEGSTGLLRTLGAAYDDLLDLHHACLRAAWDGAGGYEVNTEGDSFIVAFDRADRAVAAMVDGQRRLAAVRWPDDVRVRVRMGAHTGYARPVEGDYRALAVNQTARVVAAANGGQILVTGELVEHLVGVPDGVTIAPLGRFRVRDFEEPVALFGVDGGAGGSAEPPRARPVEGHNLVRPTTSLVGRDSDLERMRECLSRSRLVTLVGPGGVGKTRLAVEYGLRQVGTWADGVWFADLVPVGGAGVAAALRHAVGVDSRPDGATIDGLVEALEDRHALVIVDNCEHVANDAAAVVNTLLARCPHLRLLATSRVPLGLRAEAVYRVEPLVPTDSGHPGRELFLQRSGRERGTSAEVGVVTALCRELDDLPLAIELAAARATTVAPAAIIERLRSSRALLVSRDPGLPERHRSLEVTLDWSYRLLDDAAATLLAGLAALPGSFDLAAAADAGTAGGLAAEAVPDLLWTLVDSSLVHLEPGAPGRYVLHRSVRAQPPAGPDPARVMSRVAEGFADRLGPARALDRQWLDRVRADLHILRWLVTGDSVDADHAQQLAWSIGYLHMSEDTFRAGSAELTALAGRLGAATPSRVGLLVLLGELHLKLGELATAGVVLDGAAQLASEVGQPAWDDAAVARAEGDLATRRGDAALAVEIATNQLPNARLARSRARLHNMVGIARMELGDMAGAAEAARAEIAEGRAAGLETFLVNSHGNLAEILLRLGDLAGAAGEQLEALVLARTMSLPVPVGFSETVAAHLDAELGRWPEAVWLQGAADAQLAAAEIVLYGSDLEHRRAMLAAARENLGDDAFDTAYGEGQTARPAVAIDLTEQRLAEIATSGAGRRGGSP